MVDIDKSESNNTGDTNDDDNDNNSNDSILILGAGVGRTGTSSLKAALEILYKQPCYHLKEICLRKRGDMKKWLELDERLNNGPDKKLDKAVVQQMLQGYVAALDHPVCAYFKELLDIYPNAKVILTTRDPEMWLTGCRFTILPRDVTKKRSWAFYIVRKVMGLEYLQQLYLTSWRRVLGVGVDFRNDTELLNGFINWNQRVAEIVPKQKLLIFDIGKGWAPLCDFLKLPIPECSFPHVNEYHEIKRLKRLENTIVYCLQWLLPILMMVGLAYLIMNFISHI